MLCRRQSKELVTQGFRIWNLAELRRSQFKKRNKTKRERKKRESELFCSSSTS